MTMVEGMGNTVMEPNAEGSLGSLSSVEVGFF